MNTDDGNFSKSKIAKFGDFLSDHMTKGTDDTHGMIPGGKLHIDSEDIDKFYDLYSEFCKTGYPTIIERPCDIEPLLTDYDFVFGMDHKKREYTTDHIERAVKILNKIIHEIIRIKKNDIIAYVTEKEHPTIDNGKSPRVKDGFHIVYMIALSTAQRLTIYEKFKKSVIDHDCFEDIKSKNSYDDILDVSTIRQNGWMMYGSRKGKDKKGVCGQSYKLTHMYDYECNEMKIPKKSFIDWVKLFSIRQFENSEPCDTRDDYIDTVKETERKLTKKDKPKNKSELPVRADDDDESSDGDDKIGSVKPKRSGKLFDVEMAQNLVALLSKKRASAWEDWIHVGWALKHTGDELYDTFITFSKRCKSKFDQKMCDKIWNTKFTDEKKPLTIASLHWWAKQDSPNEYKDLIWKSLDQLLIAAESGQPVDIATIVYEMYKYQFKCVDIKENSWYEYQGQKWVSITQANSLRKLITDEIAPKFLDEQLKYVQMARATNSSDKYEIQNMKDKMDAIMKIFKSLKTTSFLNNVVFECAHKFFDDKFVDALDLNKHLIGFENGVLDMDEIIFRNGCPEDNISLSTNYNYPIDMKESEQVVTDVTNYLKQIFPNKHLLEYTLKHLASKLNANNKDQLFIFWTGSGCHSPETLILMADGTSKCAKDVKIGDMLMGDDSTPRRVRELMSGSQQMWEIRLDDGTTYIVNDNHRLALKSCYSNNIEYDDMHHKYIVSYHKLESGLPVLKMKEFNVPDITLIENVRCLATGYIENKNKNDKIIKNGDIIPVMVKNYIKLPDNIKKYYKNFRNVVQFNTSPIPLDPYLVGVRMTTSQIPMMYKINSIQVRTELLSGIIDKFGKYENNKLIINCNSKIFADDCIFVSRSLGYQVHVIDDNNFQLTGKLSQLTTRIIKFSKADDNDNELLYSFTISSLGIGKYCGFSVDKNERYILENYVVTYNSNGKSLFTKLIRNSFGEYYDTLEHTVLTRQRGSASNATPELADKKGKRIITLAEPEGDDVIHCAFMKQLSGDDVVKVRQLYKKQTQLDPMFTMILICNDLPRIIGLDGGTWRRIRAVPFDAVFQNTPITGPNQFKIDPTIEKKLSKWHCAFMWLLVNVYYKMYKENGLETKLGDGEPAEVMAKTNKYHNDCDIYNEFLSTLYIITKKVSDTMSLNAVYKEFKDWYKDSGNGEKCPNRKSFANYVEKSGTLRMIDDDTIGGLASKDSREEKL